MMKAVFLLFVVAWTTASARTLTQAVSARSSATATSSGEPSSAFSFAFSGTPPRVDFPIDVYFLADNTGSMGSVIAQVRNDAVSLLQQIFALSIDAQVGVGKYRDEGDAFVFMNQLAIQPDQAAAQAAINDWSAFGGGDFPEAQLFALETIAVQDEIVAFRPGSLKIIVWIGDAPGRDPTVNGVTEASATNALVAAGIRVLAIDVGSLDSTGQASRIASATMGALFQANVFNPAPDTTTVSADGGGGSSATSSATGDVRAVQAASGGDSAAAVEAGGDRVAQVIVNGLTSILLG